MLPEFCSTGGTQPPAPFPPPQQAAALLWVTFNSQLQSFLASLSVILHSLSPPQRICGDSLQRARSSISNHCYVLHSVKNKSTQKQLQVNLRSRADSSPHSITKSQRNFNTHTYYMGCSHVKPLNTCNNNKTKPNSAYTGCYTNNEVRSFIKISQLLPVRFSAQCSTNSHLSTHRNHCSSVTTDIFPIDSHYLRN